MTNNCNEKNRPQKGVVLDKIKESDMKYIYEWFKDVEFLKFYDYVPPVPQSKEEVDKTFKYYADSKETDVFAIRLIENNQIIGIAGFLDIIKENKVATLFIGIGSKDIRGKGYGKESLKLLIEYGFNELDLHRIQLNVLEFNNVAISLYEKFGFKKEGAFREFVLRDGKRYDLCLYGLLKSEYSGV